MVQGLGFRIHPDGYSEELQETCGDYLEIAGVTMEECIWGTMLKKFSQAVDKQNYQTAGFGVSGSGLLRSL